MGGKLKRATSYNSGLVALSEFSRRVWKIDNEPIGIILSGQKNDLTVEYALGGISNKLFVSKYQLYLPKKEELEAEARRLLE